MLILGTVARVFRRIGLVQGLVVLWAPYIIGRTLALYVNPTLGAALYTTLVVGGLVFLYATGEDPEP